MKYPTDLESGWLLDEYDEDRFWSRVNFRGGSAHLTDPLATATGDCWTFGGYAPGQYTRFLLHGHQEVAHRVAYRDSGRKVEPGQSLDHLCRNPNCIRPSHLEPVEHIENVRRGIIGHKTHCPSGHEYSAENTKIVTRSNGLDVRRCLTCLRASRHKTYLRRKANQ